MMRHRPSHFKKLQNKRYAAHAFANPYFRTCDKKKRLKRAGLLVLSCILVVFVIWLLTTPVLRIRTVSIEGAQSITQEELMSVIWPYLDSRRWVLSRQSNRLLFDASGLREQLEDRYAFERLEIRNEKDVLRVVFEEKASYLLWQSADDVYVVDLQGTVIRRHAGGEETAELPLFVDRNAIPVDIRSQVLTAEEVQNIFRFHEHLLRQNIGFVRTELDRLAGKWTSVVAADGYSILFDATGDMDAQARNLEVLLRDTIPDPRGLQYIDLRFGDHVYYK